jgi:hypothetical protein
MRLCEAYAEIIQAKRSQPSRSNRERSGAIILLLLLGIMTGVLPQILKGKDTQEMIYTIVAEMSAAGAGFHRFLRRHEDADGKVIIYQTYEEAVKRCEQLNARKVDRNLSYRVERKLTHYFGNPLPTSQKGLTKPSQ